VLFLDEPTTGLDPTGRAATWDVIADMTRDGTTVLLTTQYLDEADRFASRVAVIDHGRVVAEGTPANLKSRIGRATLSVQLDETYTAATLLEVVTPFAASQPYERGGELMVPLRDLTVTADLMAALAEAGIALNDVSVVKPSMDDVFFELTGQREPQMEQAA
jgi:ABC-type multidrug transport system ATPase subunit